MSVESYEMGKIAALEDLADVIDAGASAEQCYSVIGNTLNAPMNKQASREDVDYRVGIEETLYGFMKEAAQYYGMRDVQNEHVALVDIFEKTAASSATGDMSKGQQAARRKELREKGRSTDQLPGSVEADAGRHGSNEHIDTSTSGTASGGNVGGDRGAQAKQDYQSRGLGESAQDKLKELRGRASTKWNNMGTAGKAGVGAAGAAGLAGAGYLGYKALKGDDGKEATASLNPRRQRQGHQKQAGLRYSEDDIDTAVAILADAGYEFE